MFVSVPFLVVGAIVLLLIGMLLGGSVTVGSSADIYQDGYMAGYHAASDDLPEPRLVGEE